jgi:hypothetical protein
MPTEEQKIKCPDCGASISIDAVLTRQIESKLKNSLAAEQRTKELELEQKSNELKNQALAIAEARRSFDVSVAQKVNEQLGKEKIELWKKARLEAAKETETEKIILAEQLREKDAKLQAASEKELEIRREKNRLEEDKKNFELEKQRQLDEERQKIQEEAGQKAAEAEQYKISQLEKKLNDALKANEEQKRKLEQGSQQTQGEVLELELEDLLKAEFPLDEITGVRKGVNGADIIQKVSDKLGRACGQIIWEAKFTKNWNENFIQKLKDDQRDAKADIAVIVSAVLPDDVQTFKFRDGVWICGIKLAAALAVALRANLEAVNREKAMAVGKNEKMDIIYSYLTGVEFRQRVEAIVEAFSGMKSGLEKEKLAYQKIWTEREKQIQKVIHNTVGMYGDLSGLAPLQQIKMLELGEGD